VIVRWGYFVLVLITACSNSVEAQLRSSAQTYSGYGHASVDNHYFSTGIEGFLESDELLYIPSLGYVDATYNQTGIANVSPVNPGSPLVRTSTDSHTSLFSLVNRLDFFSPYGWNVALTLNGIVERVTYSSVPRLPSPPAPLPPAREVAFKSTTTTFYLLPGLEFSGFFDGMKTGCGTLFVSDLKSDNKTQLYGFFNSNPTRRLSVRTYSGGLIDGKFYALGKTTVSWRSTIDLEIKGSVSYARLSSVYDLDERFFSFYREKDQWSFGGLMAYDWRPDTRVFLGVKYETNRRFTMVLISAGLYYHP
jgi:hypothetical protein